MVPIESLGMVSYSHPIATMAYLSPFTTTLISMKCDTLNKFIILQPPVFNLWENCLQPPQLIDATGRGAHLPVILGY